ncbi:O-methyltransferase family 2 [Macrophomina phaseolina MS6]|uniref:O-methyltransferase family 2 n=1 Tax=Macrophomina phaseolina (strain MS6) TaxID=1126212 RepID=K2R520_MACPH|nr:O-methyltransferase family 2 [Macrophomina phaseolina MS6]
MSSNLEVLTKQLSDVVREYVSNGAPGERKQVLELADAIRAEVQSPDEKIREYLSFIMEMPTVRLLMEWDVFSKIPDRPEGISYTELAAQLDAEPRLLKRLVGLLVARGILKQIGKDHVAHTKFSPIFADKESLAQWFQFFFYDQGFVTHHWPSYFAKYGRKQPTDPKYSPISFAYGKEGKSYWEILEGRSLQDFITGMDITARTTPWKEILPFKWFVENKHLVPPDAPLIVDVGGSRGEALRTIRDECQLPSERLVLQDVPRVIEQVEKADTPELRGIRKMAHDFFQPQPMKGALAYFLKRIIHDWPDDSARVILGHLRDAMGPESRILLPYDDEFSLKRAHAG